MGAPLPAQDGQDARHGAGRLLVAGQLKERPSEIFKRQCFAVAYPEDDVKKIVDEIGCADPILMGSDYPHPEGVARPRDFVEEALPGLNDRQIEQIMYSNGRRMLPRLS